jgi:3',5'-nucleoside bisphosphate phosphatase
MYFISSDHASSSDHLPSSDHAPSSDQVNKFFTFKIAKSTTSFLFLTNFEFNKMKKYILVILVSILVTRGSFAQFVRKEMVVPDIPGYVTLKCDFHIHTVFSDGNVWPTVRVEEAWLMGYDAISITDHIEYQPHKKYIPVQHNAGYEIAKPQGDRQGMIVIQGSEITRVMPPGHLNAIFIQDATRIETERIGHMHSGAVNTHGYLDSIDHQHQDYLLAIGEAVDQGGFVFWNHPGWDAQAPEGIRIYDVHKDLIKRGWLKGIEVANWDTWYPEAFRWCLDYGLTMLSNSDIHQTEEIYEKITNVTRRPVTLVFARERNAESIREALVEARTAVWFNELVIGKKEFLQPLFGQSIRISRSFFTDNDGNQFYNLSNVSDFNLTLQPVDGKETIDLMARSTVIVTVKEDKRELEYVVSNFMIEPEKSLSVKLTFE